MVVEVKRGQEAEAETAKQVGYKRWLDAQTEPVREARLLITGAAGTLAESDGEFTPVRWADVCIRLRRLAPELIADDHCTIAGLVLAFVGAVEQNLLGYSAAVVAATLAGRPRLGPWASSNTSKTRSPEDDDEPDE